MTNVGNQFESVMSTIKSYSVFLSQYRWQDISSNFYEQKLQVEWFFNSKKQQYFTVKYLN